MIKKIFYALIIVALAAVALSPWWSTELANNAFKNPDNPNSPEITRRVVQFQSYLLLHANARRLAEKGIIYFPESEEHLPTLIYTAALCAQRQGKPMVALHWYERFVKDFPEHMWTDQAKNHIAKIKEMHGENG